MIQSDDHTVISRRRKKYKFAQFQSYPNCFELDEWQKSESGSDLTLEIGAGSAIFSVELAAKYPGRSFVAMDVKADRLQRGAKLALERGLTNITFLRAHAEHLQELFAPRSVSELWMTFPDPQPKKRNAKHRLTHPVFLVCYRQLLAENGSLRFKTDDHALFDWSIEQLVAAGWHISVLTYDLHGVESHEDAKTLTTYEQKFLSEGLKTHYLEASAS